MNKKKYVTPIYNVKDIVMTQGLLIGSIPVIDDPTTDEQQAGERDDDKWGSVW